MSCQPGTPKLCCGIGSSTGTGKIGKVFRLDCFFSYKWSNDWAMMSEVDPGDGISLLMSLNFKDIPDGHIGYVIQNPATNYDPRPYPPNWPTCFGPFMMEMGTYYAGHRLMTIPHTDQPGYAARWCGVGKCVETNTYTCWVHFIVVRALIYLKPGSFFSVVRRNVLVGCSDIEGYSGTYGPIVCQRPYGPIPRDGFIIEPPDVAGVKDSAFLTYWTAPCP